jgi:chitinase
MNYNQTQVSKLHRWEWEIHYYCQHDANNYRPVFQWLSYDDVESLKDKKNFASKQGLRGLFIWAIDQDDKDHSALYALVDQGKFADSNGVGSFKNWDAATSSCYWSDCSTSNPTCRTRGTLPNGHQVKCAGGGHKTLCCPLDHQPDPKSCRWAGGKGLIFLDCQASKCNDDEVTIEESDYYWNNGDSWCYKGTAKYCCKGVSNDLHPSKSVGFS